MKSIPALLPALCILPSALCMAPASAAVGDATVAKWADDARGAFMLMFVPGLNLTRGGGAWMVKTLYVPAGISDYYLVLGSIAVAAGVSYLLMEPLTRLTVRFVSKFNYRHVSTVALVVIVLMVLLMTGWVGLFIAAVGTGIGLLPVLFGSRRLNCLGILLLPIACNMSGFGSKITAFLGLT